MCGTGDWVVRGGLRDQDVCTSVYARSVLDCDLVQSESGAENQNGQEKCKKLQPSCSHWPLSFLLGSYLCNIYQNVLRDS